eukprot:8554434-Pyramimonas_sp.AAC.1
MSVWSPTQLGLWIPTTRPNFRRWPDLPQGFSVIRVLCPSRFDSLGKMGNSLSGKLWHGEPPPGSGAAGRGRPSCSGSSGRSCRRPRSRGSRRPPRRP